MKIKQGGQVLIDALWGVAILLGFLVFFKVFGEQWKEGKVLYRDYFEGRRLLISKD